jgi:hypothetical protein
MLTVLVDISFSSVARVLADNSRGQQIESYLARCIVLHKICSTFTLVTNTNISVLD